MLAGLPEPLPDRRIPLLVQTGLELQGGRSALARACGFANVSKGCRRIDEWLAGDGCPLPDRHPQVAAGLGVDVETLRGACVADAELEWMRMLKRRASNPAFLLVFRAMAGVYRPTPFSADLTLRVALAQARTASISESGRFRRCLDLPDATQIFLTAEGDRESVTRGNPVSGGLLLSSR
ncbi:MAG: hypothetical protein FJ109_12430 [Deltaproteobacteria bacterium]|nr:hypothetical protein [Deltaproteobacteria bacterium]